MPEFGRNRMPEPYISATEAGFGLAAVMPGRKNLAARMWVVAGASVLGCWDLRSPGPDLRTSSR